MTIWYVEIHVKSVSTRKNNPQRLLWRLHPHLGWRIFSNPIYFSTIMALTMTMMTMKIIKKARVKLITGKGYWLGTTKTIVTKRHKSTSQKTAMLTLKMTTMNKTISYKTTKRNQRSSLSPVRENFKSKI